MGLPVPRRLRSLPAAVRSRDHGFDALRRAVRTAIIVPIVAALAVHVGGPQTPLFAIFGTIALLVLVDFPGNRTRRAVSFAGLAVVGYVFITVGTVLATPAWVGVISMLVVGVVVSYLAILSSSFAAGQRAALLAFVLPVAVPDVGPISDRLLGWTLALVFCVPAALYFLPPDHHDALRRRVREVCETLAEHIAMSDTDTASTARVMDAMSNLRQAYLGTDSRPTGLTAGSRALARVVDDLEWLAAQTTHGQTRLPEEVRDPASAVLRRCVEVLREGRSPDDDDLYRQRLVSTATDLTSVLRNRFGHNVEQIVAEASEPEAEATGARLLTVHTVGTTVALVGRTIAWSSAADARPMNAKVLGRQLPPTGAADLVLSELEATRKAASPVVIARSVIARNALRTGVGLAAAVALIQMVPVQHGFWVVLGAMSVLRSSALTTGSKVVRAVAGTTAGFVIGGAIVVVLGTNGTLLWILLPFAAFGAAYIPKVFSFAAGQAAFTVLVITMFNILKPSGWHVGLIRVEDVAIGCAVAVVVSFLLWPRGVAATARAAIDSATGQYLQYLDVVVGRLLRGTERSASADVTNHRNLSVIAYRTADDAARQYLSESGGPTDERTPMLRAFGQATRLRVVADSIADLPLPPDPDGHPRLRAVVRRHTDKIRAGHATHTDVGVGIAEDAVSALRADAADRPLDMATARPLIGTCAYLGELELMYGAAEPFAESPLGRPST